jgi:predicted GNAT family acetyltransferase
MATPTVTDDPQHHRFVIQVDGVTVGVAEYRLAGEDRIIFTHTEVDQTYEGQGLGSTLAAAALDQARDRGLAVEPRCPFIAAYIQRHPEYADLVAG